MLDPTALFINSGEAPAPARRTARITRQKGSIHAIQKYGLTRSIYKVIATGNAPFLLPIFAL